MPADRHVTEGNKGVDRVGLITHKVKCSVARVNWIRVNRLIIVNEGGVGDRHGHRLHGARDKEPDDGVTVGDAVQNIVVKIDPIEIEVKCPGSQVEHIDNAVTPAIIDIIRHINVVKAQVGTGQIRLEANDASANLIIHGGEMG